MRRLDAQAARALVHSEDEVAFLDVREAGEFGEGHPLFAVPLPYSRLEARIGALVPRRDTALVLIDGGDGVAERAAVGLEGLGYTDVAVIRDGVGGWAAAAFELYKGVNVPSKTLGELAEALWHPETVRAEELATWQSRGQGVALFDARPPEEYAKMTVPGARCVPNGELAHRLAGLAQDRPLEDVPIVVTCAGRTRGIVGAIGLRLAGYGGPLYALENGTQGWALAGMNLDRGSAPEPYPSLDAVGLAQSRDRATAILKRHGIPRADGPTVAAMLGDAGRTTFLFDLRTEQEAGADPLAAATRAPGGQLVQATDQWVGVRRARIVLCDDGGLRSAIAAFWLKQLGYEPIVAPIDDALRALPAPALAGPARATGVIAARAAREAVVSGAVLVDLRGSMAYRCEHVAGAVWAIRPHFSALEPLAGRRIVAISDHRAVADMAAVDLVALGAARVDWVEGGHAALVAAGAPTERGSALPTDEAAIDHLFFVHDRHDGNLEASRRYLEWETGLLGQLDAAEKAQFTLIGPQD